MLSPVIAALHGPPEEDPAAVAHADVGAIMAVLPGPAVNTHLFECFTKGLK